MKNTFIRFILWYVRFWAKIALRIHRPKIIGIAGSAGKSSCKQAVYAALRDHFFVKKLEGNSETGVPLSILGIHPKGYSPLHWVCILLRVPFGVWYLHGTQYCIAEMGIDDPHPPKNMEYLLTILQPDIAVSLNISATHTEQFEKIVPEKIQDSEKRLEYILQAMAKEDTKIITQSHCTTAIANGDDHYIMDAIQPFAQKNSNLLQTFGTEKHHAIHYTAWEISESSTTFRFTLNQQDATQDITLQFEGFLLPQVYRETFAAAILASMNTGLPLPEIIAGIQNHFTLPKGRASLFAGIKNSIIIDSSYNASRQPMLTFLELAQLLKKNTNRPLVFICGDMRELGASSQIEHEAVARAAETAVDRFYCVGEMTQKYMLPIVEKTVSDSRWFANAQLLGLYIQEHLPENAIVLVKGSQNTIYLEEAVKVLLNNQTDTRLLCRQSPYWTSVKNTYFQRTSSQ